MKKQLIGISLLSLVLVIGLIVLSCGSGPQNTNQASNTANSQNANASNDGTLGPMRTGCSAGDISDRMDAIMNKYPDVKKQRDGVDHPDHLHYFKYRVDQDGEWLVLVIAGGLSDGTSSNHGGNSEFMEHVTKEIDQLVKKDCAVKAVFISQSEWRELESGRRKLRDVNGFEWSSCEWPTIACPGGYCSERCDRDKSPTPTPGPSVSPSPEAARNAASPPNPTNSTNRNRNK